MRQDIKPIMDELKIIKSKLTNIEDHIVDIDTLLTDEDEEALRKADEDYQKGKTKRLI